MENLENKSENLNKSAVQPKPMIEGANLWAHFNVRCPGCNKLYRINSREIKSTQPHFSCTGCRVVFSFDFPPKQLMRVETRIVKVNAIEGATYSNKTSSKFNSTTSLSEILNLSSNSSSNTGSNIDSYSELNSQSLNAEINSMNRLGLSFLEGNVVPSKTNSYSVSEASVAPNAHLIKACPKCGVLNPKMTKECIKCGVIFEKLENLPLDPKVGALPSLVRMWQDLMRDYENLAKHLEFVDRCEDLEALPFAMSKYQELKAMQPQDSLADEMFQMVWLKNFKLRAEKIPGVRKLFERTEGVWQKVVQTVPWARIFRFSPYVVSSLMILVGIITPWARNLAGTGASLLFLSLGILFLWKGRIHWEDLW